MNPKIVIVLLFLSMSYSSLAANPQRYQNLGNPTQFVFSAPYAEVLAVLRKERGPRSWGPLAGSYYEDERAYGFGVFDYYTKRYWAGRQEKRAEVDPPEAGRIGTIQNHFLAHVIAKGDTHTLVSVTVESFEQQVGRRYKIFPHFKKVGVFVDVKSDTYFEYLFLFKLGQLLGEEDMPPLKGPAD
jgi:hypothetical protein